MLSSLRAIAGRFAAIQGCPGTWLTNPKYPYVHVLTSRVRTSLAVDLLSKKLKDGQK